MNFISGGGGGGGGHMMGGGVGAPTIRAGHGMVGGGDSYKSNSSLDLDSEVEIVQQAVAGASFFGPPPGATSNSRY